MEDTNRLSIPKVRAILEHSVPATVAAQLPPRAPPRKCYANNAAASAADTNVNGAPKPVGIVVAAHPQPTPMSTAANVTGTKRKSCDADSTPDAASAAIDIGVGSSCAWQELNVNANVNGAKRKSCDADSTHDARDYDQYSCVQPNADKPACKGSATAQLALDAEPMPAVHVRANADVGTILPATAKWVDVASVDACALSQVATMVKWTSRSRECGGVAAEVESLVVEHGIIRNSMPRIFKKCPHNRRKHRCRECGGVGICEHGRLRSRCHSCGGASVCEHGRAGSGWAGAKLEMIRSDTVRAGARTSILTEDQAVEVFLLRPAQRTDRAWLCAQLAERYHVTSTTIRHIWDRRTWV